MIDMIYLITANMCIFLKSTTSNHSQGGKAPGKPFVSFPFRIHGTRR